MRIISIDDNVNNLLMIEVYGKSLGISVESFQNSKLALERVKTQSYDLVVVDYMMPEIDGLRFIEEFRKRDTNTPIIMITAVGDDDDVHMKALSIGATDFMKKPINGAIFKLRVTNFLQLKKAQILLSDRTKLLEEEVKKATKDILARELESLNVIGKTAEYKDPETGEHINRVSNYSVLLAKGMGLSDTLQDLIFHASPLHDIGKVGIPDYILLKPGPLNEEEWSIMKTHPLIGYEILKRSQSNFLSAGAIIAFTHHEKYDGTGYPKGLKGEDIPLLGRIVALADVFDALTTKRPYKNAWEFNAAVDEIIRLKGTHFDPTIVQLFIEHLDEIRKIYEDI